MTDNCLIQAEHISRYYGDTCAVHDLSFELARGEVLGFLGPNGAGKSTTMQILTGNLAPSAGRVRINGTDLLDNPKTAKAQLGYLPEQPPLYRELTVDEYLGYCARLNRLPHKAIPAAIDTAKQRCGLTEVSRRLIGNLSKGYQQRVGIAQAIIHTPPVVILDEPTVGLDPIQIREIRALIRDLGREHGIILSTHILPEVQAVCTRVQIIHQGALVFADTLANLNRRGAESLIVGLRNAAVGDELAGLAGINGVESLGEGRWRVTHAVDTHCAELIADTAAARGWGLYELTPETQNLEQVFMAITHTDAGADRADTGGQAA